MTDPLPHPAQADVVIVGAGIMGCAAAYYLARAGASVVLLDKGGVAGQQSSRAWGFVRVQARDPAEIPLMLESLRMWRGLERELDAPLGWREGGCLFLAHDEREAEEQEEWLALARPWQTGTRRVTGAEVAGLVPALARPAPLGGLWTATDGQAEPRLVAPAFARRAREMGAQVVEGCGVTGLEVAGGRVAGVRTEAGTVRAGTVIVAAGAASRAVLATLGLDLPQQAVRGTVLRTNPVAPLTAAAVTGFGVGFRQRADGSLNVADGLAVDVDLTLGHLGALRLFAPGLVRHRRSFSLRVGRPAWADLRARAGRRGPPAPLGPAHDPDPAATPARVERALVTMRALFPSAGPLRAVETWGGLIDCTPDALPVIDAPGRPEGLLVATGFSAHGFALGPVVGRLLAEWATRGRPALDLHALRFGRFAEGDVKMPYAL